MCLICGGGVSNKAPFTCSVPRIVFGEAALGVQLPGSADSRVRLAEILLCLLLLIGAEVDSKLREGLPVYEYLLDYVLLLLLRKVFHIFEPIAMPGLILEVPLSLSALPIQTHEHVNHGRAT